MISQHFDTLPIRQVPTLATYYTVAWNTVLPLHIVSSGEARALVLLLASNYRAKVATMLRAPLSKGAFMEFTTKSGLD